jgi:hypothetical protein
MMHLKPEVLRRGSLLSRAWSFVANLLRGRRIVECRACEGTGVVLRLTIEEFGASPRTSSTYCRRCDGEGAHWS